MADKSSPARGGGPPAKPVVEGAELQAPRSEARPLHQPAAGPPPPAGEDRVRTVLASAATHLAPNSASPPPDPAPPLAARTCTRRNHSPLWPTRTHTSP